MSLNKLYELGETRCKAGSPDDNMIALCWLWEETLHALPYMWPLEVCACIHIQLIKLMQLVQHKCLGFKSTKHNQLRE